MWPNRLIARAYLWRGIRLWCLARLLLMLVITAGNMNPLKIGAGGSIVIVSVAVALGLVELRIRRERALIGNLGISRWWLVAMHAGTAALGELVVATVLTIARP